MILLLKNRKYFDANTCNFVIPLRVGFFLKRGTRGKTFFSRPPRRSTFDFLATGSKKYKNRIQ